MNYTCKKCGAVIDLGEVEPDMSHVECPHCGGYLMAEIEHQALIYAEKIGVYQYNVNTDGWFEYWSFFPGEGFRFIQHNLNDGEERRDGFIPWTNDDGIPVPMFLIGEHGGTLYNYNVG